MLQRQKKKCQHKHLTAHHSFQGPANRIRLHAGEMQDTRNNQVNTCTWPSKETRQAKEGWTMAHQLWPARVMEGVSSLLFYGFRGIKRRRREVKRAMCGQCVGLRSSLCVLHERPAASNARTSRRLDVVLLPDRRGTVGATATQGLEHGCRSTEYTTVKKDKLID